MSDLVTMGGYGAYVWAAFGVTFIVLGGLLLQSWRYARKRTAELAAAREHISAQRPDRTRRLVAQRIEEQHTAGELSPEG